MKSGPDTSNAQTKHCGNPQNQSGCIQQPLSPDLNNFDSHSNFVIYIICIYFWVEFKDPTNIFGTTEGKKRSYKYTVTISRTRP